MFSFILLIGCSGEPKEKTEEDYNEIVNGAVEYFWDGLPSSDWDLDEKYGDDIRGTSTVKIYDNGRYVHLEVPYLNYDDGSVSNNYYEHEDGEFSFMYEEDFEKAIGDKDPVYVEEKGAIVKK